MIAELCAGARLPSFRLVPFMGRTTTLPTLRNAVVQVGVGIGVLVAVSASHIVEPPEPLAPRKVLAERLGL